MSAKRVVYFEEGDGYFPIRTLGTGGDGTATLVRARHDGALYVRKEPTWTESTPGTGETFRTPHGVDEKIPREGQYSSREYTMARWLQGQHNIYETVRRAYYANTDQKLGYGVSYFKFYNLGSLTDVHLQLPQPMPEYWVAKLMLSMVKTLSSMHWSGMVHTDVNSNNWFLEYSPADLEEQTAESVDVYLGDCARVLTTEEREADNWDRVCQTEAFRAVYIADDSLMLGHGLAQSDFYSQEFQNLARGFLNLEHAPLDEFVERVVMWEVAMQEHIDSLAVVPWPLQPPSPIRTKYVREDDRAMVTENEQGERLIKWFTIAELDRDDRLVNVDFMSKDDMNHFGAIKANFFNEG